jgi:hypothetical protein
LSWSGITAGGEDFVGGGDELVENVAVVADFVNGAERFSKTAAAAVERRCDYCLRGRGWFL